MYGRAGGVWLLTAGWTLPAGAGVGPISRPRLMLLAGLACLVSLALVMPAATAPGRGRGVLGRSGTSVALGLALSASVSIGASERRFWPVREGATLVTKGGGIEGTFVSAGAVLRVRDETLELALTDVGDAQRLEPVAQVRPTQDKHRILYRYASVSESYENGSIRR